VCCVVCFVFESSFRYNNAYILISFFPCWWQLRAYSGAGKQGSICGARDAFSRQLRSNFPALLLQITLGLSVKSDEVIKEQQLVLQLNVSKQDALAKSKPPTSLRTKPQAPNLTQTPNPQPPTPNTQPQLPLSPHAAGPRPSTHSWKPHARLS
jgi:hypothetical protein